MQRPSRRVRRWGRRRRRLQRAVPRRPLVEDPPDDLRPGDIVRLVGFLPAKLREALAALDDSAASEVLTSVDELLTGSAGMLRAVRHQVIGLHTTAETALDAVLAPIAAAQVDAQLALQGSAVLSADGFDVDVSFALLASAGPGPLERSLDGERALVAERCASAAATLSGAVADDLDAVAQLLDAVLPSALLSDVDALLAALDPEPIALEFDALLAVVLDATPGFLTAAEAELRGARHPDPKSDRHVQPRHADATVPRGARCGPRGAGAARSRSTGRRIGRDPCTGESSSGRLRPTRSRWRTRRAHRRRRCFDPRSRPVGLLPDLSGLGTQVARLGDILPVNALEGVGTELEAVGDELRALDVQGMLDAVNALTPEIADAITILIEAVRTEVVNLLESIRFSASSGSASGSVSVGVG